MPLLNALSSALTQGAGASNPDAAWQTKVAELRKRYPDAPYGFTLKTSPSGGGLTDLLRGVLGAGPDSFRPATREEWEAVQPKSNDPFKSAVSSVGAALTSGRALTALATGGLSEGFGIKPALEAGAKALMPTLPDVPKGGSPPVEGQPVQRAVAEGSLRRKLARGFRSTILSQLTRANPVALRETIGS